jgi:hypothetical protein
VESVLTFRFNMPASRILGLVFVATRIIIIAQPPMHAS